MLRTSGYAVSQAANAKEAFDLLEKREGTFDLLFTDVILPDRDGLQFVADLLHIDPGLAILLTSGYADDRVPRSLIDEQGYHFLPKPFELADLLAAVREALKGAQARAQGPS
jgi:two-component system cell cycle sensor histidine kinase/response regulator CckA